MVQEYLPAVTEGDKRMLLLDGEPLGAILRVPRGDEVRSNIHVGGSVVPTELTPRGAEIVRSIAPRLRADGLVFVGLDVIGERLTEVNVTSPTGIQELEPSRRPRRGDPRHRRGSSSVARRICRSTADFVRAEAGTGRGVEALRSRSTRRASSSGAARAATCACPIRA